MDSQTANINVLRAYGTGLSKSDVVKKENRPPPLPPKPKCDSDASIALSGMMASLAKLMASNLLQSEKILSNHVAAPENGFYNIYCEYGDRYLDLDQSGMKEGTSIIAFPYVWAHNLAQTVRSDYSSLKSLYSFMQTIVEIRQAVERGFFVHLSE